VSAEATLAVLAVDDERPALEDLARLLRTSAGVIEVVCARSGNEALCRLAERQFDALFIDVRMPGFSGLELAGVLDRFASPPAIVFVSAYADGAVRAFEVHALDYLMKPVTRRRLEEAITRIARRPRSGTAYEPEDPAGEEVVALERAHGHATRIVSRDSILYLQARGDYVRIVADDGRFLQRGTLAEIERRWTSHGFHRVHRAYVVNLHRAVEVRPDLDGTASILLADGSEIPIARRHVAELRRRLHM
jgi:DNA-binding LytR/AlgR family response regulator